MTCQPAVNIGPFFLVAFEAHSHTPVFSRQTMLVFHLAMTFLAGHFFVDVPLVVEENVLGNVVDFFPWCRAIGIKIAVFLLYPWMLGNDIVMTVEAFFNWRYARKIRISHIRVAVLTLYLLNPHMNVVAERYGLLRSHGIGRYSIEYKQEAGRENQR